MTPALGIAKEAVIAIMSDGGQRGTHRTWDRFVKWLIEERPGAAQDIAVAYYKANPDEAGRIRGGCGSDYEEGTHERCRDALREGR